MTTQSILYGKDGKAIEDQSLAVRGEDVELATKAASSRRIRASPGRSTRSRSTVTRASWQPGRRNPLAAPSSFATRAELAHVIVPVHEGDRGHRQGMSRSASSLPPSVAELRELGQQLRVDSIRASDVKKSGHPTSSSSAADLVAFLFAKYLHYDFDRPENRLNDHLIFSKGHASPLLYSLYLAAGAISEAELLSFRTFGSRLQGHPTPLLPWVDVATGSLGFGLPVGVGVALSGKRLEEAPYRVWVLCGDSEMAEGSIWEALEHAAHYGLDNLVVIVDVNRL